MDTTSTERLLCELIALPSVNPAFAAPDDPEGGERQVAEFLAATAARAGLDVELRDALPGRPNLVARLSPSAKPRRQIVLGPHLDTVGGPGEHLFSPKTRNGRIYGRGACDTKGCVASMLTALMNLARSGRRPQETELVFAGFIDEEHGQRGSRAFAADGVKADLAIIGEPTRLKVVTAHKGDVWMELETRGKAAHGACPDLGRNAVHEMARIVDLLQTRYASLLRKRRHPLLGRPTVNVGTIRGGTQPNIVPDTCRISIDRRTLPGESEATVRKEIGTLLRRHRLAARLTTIRAGVCPALETSPDLPMVRAFMQAAGQRKPLGVDYFCDAAVLAAAGMPSVVFGPGDIAQAHTADEWISRRELSEATGLLVDFLGAQP